jgi:hypothetical protein
LFEKANGTQSSLFSRSLDAGAPAVRSLEPSLNDNVLEATKALSKNALNSFAQEALAIQDVITTEMLGTLILQFAPLANRCLHQLNAIPQGAAARKQDETSPT